MSFIQIVTMVSIFYVIASAVAYLRFDVGKVATKQIIILVVYIVFYLASIFMGDGSDLLVICVSGLTVGLLKRLSNVPVRIAGRPAVTKEDEYQ